MCQKFCNPLVDISSGPFVEPNVGEAEKLGCEKEKKTMVSLLISLDIFYWPPG